MLTFDLFVVELSYFLVNRLGIKHEICLEFAFGLQIGVLRKFAINIWHSIDQIFGNLFEKCHLEKSKSINCTNKLVFTWRKEEASCSFRVSTQNCNKPVVFCILVDMNCTWLFIDFFLFAVSTSTPSTNSFFFNSNCFISSSISLLSNCLICNEFSSISSGKVFNLVKNSVATLAFSDIFCKTCDNSALNKKHK